MRVVEGEKFPLGKWEGCGRGSSKLRLRPCDCKVGEVVPGGPASAL